LFLIWENLRHEDRLRRIPIRIHVNGIRGKSSTVRAIAAALRAAGIRTLDKTTGDEAVMTLPDGEQRTIRRPGAARIQEQVGVVKEAVSCKAEAVVVECMALHPLLQSASERRILRSRIGVITNVRHDHQEVMGKGLEEIADCLRCTIPANGDLVTTEQAFYPFFASKAKRRGSRINLVQAEGPSVSSERQAVVEKVCSLAGVAFEAACEEEPPWAPYFVSYKGRHVTFWDGFSINDVDSLRIFLGALRADERSPRPLVVLLNNRADRPLRMKAFSVFLAGYGGLDAVMLLGAHRLLARIYLKGQGRKGGVYALSSQSPTGILDGVLKKVPSSAMTLIGMGNHRGVAEGLSRYIRGGRSG